MVLKSVFFCSLTYSIQLLTITGACYFQDCFIISMFIIFPEKCKIKPLTSWGWAVPSSPSACFPFDSGYLSSLEILRVQALHFFWGCLHFVRSSLFLKCANSPLVVYKLLELLELFIRSLSTCFLRFYNILHRSLKIPQSMIHDRWRAITWPINAH